MAIMTTPSLIERLGLLVIIFLGEVVVGAVSGSPMPGVRRGSW